MSGWPHDMTPYPAAGTFAEVRMIYCRRCGATQVVESKAAPPLSPCPLAGSAELNVERLRDVLSPWLGISSDRELRLAVNRIAAEYAPSP